MGRPGGGANGHTGMGHCGTSAPVSGSSSGHTAMIWCVGRSVFHASERASKQEQEVPGSGVCLGENHGTRLCGPANAAVLIGRLGGSMHAYASCPACCSYDDVGGEVAEAARRRGVHVLAGAHVALLVVDAWQAVKAGRVRIRAFSGNSRGIIAFSGPFRDIHRMEIANSHRCTHTTFQHQYILNHPSPPGTVY